MFYSFAFTDSFRQHGPDKHLNMPKDGTVHELTRNVSISVIVSLFKTRQMKLSLHFQIIISKLKLQLYTFQWHRDLQALFIVVLTVFLWLFMINNRRLSWCQSIALLSFSAVCISVSLYVIKCYASFPVCSLKGILHSKTFFVRFK